MIKHTISQGEKTEVEVVIADSVRSLIIKYLKEGKEKQFSEITKGTKKKDHIIYRELNFLIDRGWIIHTGKAFSSRYRLDLKKIGVREYLTKLDVAFPSDWSINRIELIPMALHKKSLSDSSKKEIQDAINEPIPKQFINKIKIYLAAEKIPEYEDSSPRDENILTYKDLSLTDEEFMELVRILKKILDLRSEAYLHHILKLESKKKDGKFLYQPDMDPALYLSQFSEATTEIKQKSYNKPFELIISYNPT